MLLTFSEFIVHFGISLMVELFKENRELIEIVLFFSSQAAHDNTDERNLNN